MIRLRLLSAVAAVLLLAASLGCGAETSSQPTGTGSGEEGLDVTALVDDFMAARQEGLPADEFLSKKTRAAYAEHDGGLWLYDDTLPGGPGGEFEDFSTQVSPGGGDAWTAEVRTRVRWIGDAKPSEMVEELTIEGNKIVAAKRTDDLSDDGLPTTVAEKREAIYRAAVQQDYETLETLLDPATFSYSFGEEGDPIGYWRRQEKAEIPLVGDILPGVLHTRFGQNEDIYVWPSAAAKLSQEWTEEDLQAILDAGYTERDIRSFKKYVGGYAGWRAGIRADGTWLYFISGD
jgi:hypothetical protein